MVWKNDIRPSLESGVMSLDVTPCPPAPHPTTAPLHRTPHPPPHRAPDHRTPPLPPDV